MDLVRINLGGGVVSSVVSVYSGTPHSNQHGSSMVTKNSHILF